MSKWSDYIEKNGSTPLHFLNPRTKYVTNDIENFRLNICNSCPNLIQVTKQCKKCGCFMSLKAKIEASICPIGNW
jgi:hypothetical protein